jgi:hypothetical protein
MMKPTNIVLTPIANDVDYISTTETLTTPWALQLDGVLTFATPQHVTITTTSDETGETFTVVGADRNGLALTEALAGPNATVVVGTKNFATVTSVTGTADATGVTAGVNGTCESQWVPTNYRGSDFNIGVAVENSATCTMTVQHTFDDVQADGFVEDDATLHSHETIAAVTANTDGNYASPPTAIRLKITAHTSGTATLRLVHAG